MAYDRRMPIVRVPPEQLPPDLARLREEALELRGEADFIEVGANAPDLVRWYREQFYATLFYGESTGVPVRTKELLRLRLSKVHGCHY